MPLLTLCSSFSLVLGAPDTMGIPIIKSFLDSSSSQGLKDKLLPGTEQIHAHPTEISKLISKLKPKQGRMDPVVADMLSAFDRTYRDTAAVGGGSPEMLQFPDEAGSNRVASSTEENSVIWQGITTRPRKRDRESKFSSRYRSNKTESTDNSHSLGTHNGTDPHGALHPFNHFTDPNIRNHRLYDWEFETYKNFTHIDQVEDLMADEGRVTETKVAAPPSLNHHSQQQQSSQDNKEKSKGDTADSPAGWSSTKSNNGAKSKRVKIKGIPHIVISLEDTSDNNQYNLHLPMDSGERFMQRPREPLKHSSTENIVYVHGSSGEDANKFQYPEGSRTFRPSTADINEAVFVDPDQDFFTSTVRNTDQQFLTDQETSSEAQSKRRRKKLKKYNKNEESGTGSRFSNRMGEMTSASHYNGQRIEPSSLGGVNYSPVYSRNTMVGAGTNEGDRGHSTNIHRTPGPHVPMMKPTKYPSGPGSEGSHSMKSDRILYPGSEHHDDYGMGLTMTGQSQPMTLNYPTDNYNPSGHQFDGGIGNYYSLHTEPVLTPIVGGTSAVSESAHPYSHKQHELTSQEYLGGHMSRLQNALSSLPSPFSLFGLHQPQQQSTKKLTVSPADQVIAPGNAEDFYHPYAATDHQVNQYYEDSPYYAPAWSNSWFILAAIIGFTAVFALLMPSLINPGRIGKKDNRNDLDEEDLNTSTYANHYNNYQYDNTTNDVAQNSDLWTEIKGVYNDIVNMFRGDYSLLSKFKKEPEGPKIVYREEDMDDDSDEDEEDDERDRVPLRHRKREQYLKKQQKLQKQRQGQGKSTKKTLLSKSKADEGRRGSSSGKPNGKTINATSVNNFNVVSGPGLSGRESEDNHSSPRTVTGFVFPENSTLATMPFINATGFGSISDSFLREWAEVQLINHLNH